ncbi:hypothetical protein MKL09_25170 [Methylobacterium sp. J-048]|uniref:hypothetical protein n=1 Tax=Methylobacterium sp. J-048 TaxID=2836635 RepID=UPI001FB99968|nr:hypothetical protein [Methylobacterium sp. J-048]MCJ2059808.1 hypothetical protein [Methylobacterium sp. J-048]
MQGFRERETVAQTHETAEGRSLADIIADMEPAISDLERWGGIVEALGTIPSTLDPMRLYVVGKAISLVASVVRKDWEEAFNLAVTGGGGR